MNYAEIRRKAITVDPVPAPPVSEMSPDEVIALARRLFPRQNEAAATWLLQQSALRLARSDLHLSLALELHRQSKI